MILFADTVPSADDRELAAMYARLPAEGMVHSSLMCGEHYDVSSAFDPAWSCAALSWSAGGYEMYRFTDRSPIEVGPAGAVTLAPGTRYSYSASNTRPFRANTIVFPQWLVRNFRVDPLSEDDGECAGDSLKTRRFHPDRETLASMNRISIMCRSGAPDDALYEEELALLYARLIAAQWLSDSSWRKVPTVKRTTRMELGRRVNLAQQYILERYSEPQITLDAIAGRACLSKYHLIRTFRACNDCTPMQFLNQVRTDAALMLLRTSSMPIGEIAASVGYRDRAAFSRAFRNRHGMAPSSVRGRQRGRRLAPQCC